LAEEKEKEQQRCWKKNVQLYQVASVSEVQSARE